MRALAHLQISQLAEAFHEVRAVQLSDFVECLRVRKLDVTVGQLECRSEAIRRLLLLCFRLSGRFVSIDGETTFHANSRVLRH